MSLVPVRFLDILVQVMVKVARDVHIVGVSSFEIEHGMDGILRVPSGFFLPFQII
jgi:hypothetical protein